VWFLCLPVTHFFHPSAQAQSYEIDWYTIDGGGGESAGGNFALTATAGQPDTGLMSGGDYAIEGGFWSIIAAVQTPGAPLVEINLAGVQPRQPRNRLAGGRIGRVHPGESHQPQLSD
jgi:hypothetical protein